MRCRFFRAVISMTECVAVALTCPSGELYNLWIRQRSSLVTGPPRNFSILERTASCNVYFHGAADSDSNQLRRNRSCFLKRLISGRSAVSSAVKVPNSLHFSLRNFRLSLMWTIIFISAYVYRAFDSC